MCAKGWVLSYGSNFPMNIQQRKIFEIFEISYSREIMRNSVTGGHKRKKYSKYPTQGKTLCAMGWALSYDSNFPINILHCRGLDLLIYTLSCVFIKTKDHLSYFHLIFIMCINNSDKTNLTNTCSGWISSFFCYITYKYFLTLESQGVYCQIKWK